MSFGVMVARLTLDQLVEVRVLQGQQCFVDDSMDETVWTRVRLPASPPINN